MDIKLKKINDFTKELTCKIPWEDLKDSFKNEFNKVKLNHTPQGGRKGKVFGRDLELFKRNYGTAIEANFAEKSLNIFYIDIVQEFEKEEDPINFYPFGIRGHFTTDGYRLIAESIFKNIIK